MDLFLPLESKRLIYRLLSMEDTDWIHRQFSDPDMCRFFSEPPCTQEEARQIIEHYQSPLHTDHLRLAIFAKDSGAFIGTCGYHYWDQERRQVEIGYDIWKDYWRQGFMSEALSVLLNLCFEHLEVDCVYIFTHPDNIASQATVRKFGFQECEPCRSGGHELNICMKLMRKNWGKKENLSAAHE